jgi:xyloglucan-specific exo-beta-1,4-glucanase
VSHITNDAKAIDPFDRDRILHVHGGAIWETRDASSSTPSWNAPLEGLEETATLALATPPAGAPYTLINSSGRHRHEDLTTSS